MNQYTLDGVPLRDPALRWFTDRDTGLRIVPARRHPVQNFPGVDGENYIPSSPYDAGSVSISVRVKGDTNQVMRENVEYITALFTQRNRLMELREHYDNNPFNDRIAQVSLVSSLEPRMVDTRTTIVGGVFGVPDVFWRSSSVITASVPITNTATVHELIMQGGNAPISDMLFRLRGGGFSSVRIEDLSTGSILKVNQAITSTQQLVVDNEEWRSALYSNATSDVWDTKGGTLVSHNVIPNRGYGSMFHTEPGIDLTTKAFKYRVRVTGTNVTGSPTLGYRARRSYL